MMRYLVAKALEIMIPVMSAISPSLLTRIIEVLKSRAIGRMARNHKGDDYTRQMRIEAADGFFKMAARKLPVLSRNTQRKLCHNMFFNTMHYGDMAREKYKAEHGEYPPFFLVISPSMVCNLRCIGCYAWKYDKKKMLSFEEMDRLLTEAKEKMGIYFVTITGGEPTQYPHLWALVEKHNDRFFQMYTHGHNIDEAMAKRIADLGNLYPAISIEGGEKETDHRRGKGAYQKVLNAMKLLRNAGALFGFSVTHTKLNHEAVVEGQFFDDMIGNGAAFGWFFQYILFGKDPDPALVPTAQQRYERREAVATFRREKPILVFDFWNDGECVEGCLAWGRKYVHITASGMVEPCVFAHFAKDNIRDKSLVDIVNSDVFKAARKLQPFGGDLRRPCPVIDHPDVLKKLVEDYKLMCTDGDGVDIITKLHPVVCEQSKEYKDYLDRLDAEGGCKSCSCGCTKSAEQTPAAK